jgi:transposase
MALTIVETRAITGGVDTHADVHVAAALDPIGGLLGVKEFPATAAGYGRLLSWLSGFGTVCLVGIEGTGSYGAGLAGHITTAGVQVVEVDRSDRQDRRRQGKSDPLDAVSAARAAQSGRARGVSKGRDGAVEAIAGLVATEQTNPEIAAALYISVKTVEANLTRIYRKLGLRGRVDLARRNPG